MVYDGIILSLILGLIRKGSLKGLARIELKYGWVFPLLLIFQIGVFYFQQSSDLIARFSSYSFMLVYIVGLIFLWLNRASSGFMWILAGVFLNFLAMAVNGGRMPVSVDVAAKVLDPSYIQELTGGLYAKHAAMSDSTLLGFLGDVIAYNRPYLGPQVISIGDIIMNIGIFIYIQFLMVTDKTHINSSYVDSMGR
ncbi:DUF5317 domain-containing protein [Ferviditalea candida]|uniref:DUF5317 domain-containing protein n=1 Tax=Ferviditalea candida TaxID=3108399 RepID=A0ABU5ZLZ4_9BACL|nr:DUF5317 domain-containing protein [Paenibacillaceae bacterium T2]